MITRLKILGRCFSNEKFFERLKELEPITSSSVPHKNFTSFLMYSSFPILAGGVCATTFSAFDLFTLNIPSIVINTMLYSSLHATLLAGAHFGFASSLYVGNSDCVESKSLNSQLFYPFIAPILTTFFTYSYWGFPYTHLKSLYTISGIGFMYLGVFLADSYYSDRVKLVPLWYTNLKLKVTVTSLIGILFLLYAVFNFPEKTKWTKLNLVNKKDKQAE